MPEWIAAREALNLFPDSIPLSWAQSLLMSFAQKGEIQVAARQCVITGETECEIEVEDGDRYHIALMEHRYGDTSDRRDIHGLPDEYVVISESNSFSNGGKDYITLNWSHEVWDYEEPEFIDAPIFSFIESLNWRDNKVTVCLGDENKWPDYYGELDGGPYQGIVRRTFIGVVFDKEQCSEVTSHAYLLSKRKESRAGVGGRVPKYNWKSALAHLVAVANSPDGLHPDGNSAITGSGISRILAAWFSSIGEDVPVKSELDAVSREVVTAIHSLSPEIRRK